jgi:MFS family permease
MYAAISSSWALLLGIGLIMLGNGLQVSLLGLRATVEGFPTTVTGIVMSGYYIGFLAGSILAPWAVKRVGHIRVFAALASLASVAALVPAVFVDPAVWTGMRILTGLSFAGIYVVTESWLNDRGTNANRGQLLSIYMVIVLGGLAGGQLLLNVASPGGYDLFILISILVSVALIPILLTATPAPMFDAPAPVGPVALFRISPLGVTGCFGTGLAHGAFFSMGAVYADQLGLSVAGISVFMGLYTVGGMVLQWPIGRLSDRLDRRRVMTGVTLLAAVVALISNQTATGDGILFFVLTCLFGGLSLPMYSLCLAHTNDHLRPDQLVAASSSLVLISGVGAVIGPLATSTAMSILGSGGFYNVLVAAHAAIGVFALYRMTRRASLPLDRQAPSVAVSSPSSPVAAGLAPQIAREQIEETGPATGGDPAADKENAPPLPLGAPASGAAG